ncbi:hypothetical protein BsWGS_03211 [Bradybaena similaris]
MIWLTVLLYHLIVCEYVLRSVKAGWRHKRTIVGSYPVCPRGCTACSRVNGCVTCEPRLFMLLLRDNTRQTGVCTPSCPAGYFGVRHQFYSKCYRCHIDHCHSCFDRNFCTLCQDPYLASEGQCIARCPDGLFYANYTRECKDRVDCLPGPWTAWSECTRHGQTCGYRWGSQNRTQHVLQPASPNGDPCPQLTHSQRCRLPRPQCHEAHNGGVLAWRSDVHPAGPSGSGYSVQVDCIMCVPEGVDTAYTWAVSLVYTRQCSPLFSTDHNRLQTWLFPVHVRGPPCGSTHPGSLYTSI